MPCPDPEACGYRGGSRLSTGESTGSTSSNSGLVPTAGEGVRRVAHWPLFPPKASGATRWIPGPVDGSIPIRKLKPTLLPPLIHNHRTGRHAIVGRSGNRHERIDRGKIASEVDANGPG